VGFYEGQERACGETDGKDVWNEDEDIRWNPYAWMMLYLGVAEGYRGRTWCQGSADQECEGKLNVHGVEQSAEEI